VKDDAADLALPHWAGVVPMRIAFDAPEPAPELAAGCGVPASVRALMQTSGGTP
jgi:uncharacterized protein